MSVSKANRFIRVAKEAGWSTKYEVLSTEDQVIKVIATRGNEKVVIEWARNQLSYSPEYHLHEMQIKIHSRLDAERILQRLKPDYEKYHRWQKSSRLAARATAGGLSEPTSPAEEGSPYEHMEVDLPFSIEEDSDGVILKAIRGNVLVYRNSISGSIERTLVPWRMSGGPGGFRVYNTDTTNVFYLEDSKDGRTYVSFMDINGVFRAVHLDRLLAVV